MKNCLSLLLILCTITVFSQKNKVGVSFSPDFAFRVYKSKMGGLGETWGMNQQPKAGYTFTAQYERELTKNWSFVSGLLFTNKGYQGEKMDLRFSDRIFIDSSSLPEYHAFRNRFSYFMVGIPLGINYYIRLKKVNFFFGGGVGVNYLINVRYTGILYRTDGRKPKVSHSNDDMIYYSRISLSTFAQGGIEINMPRNLKFRIAPNVSYSLTNVMDKKVIYKIYPYSIGIGYGVFWGF